MKIRSGLVSNSSSSSFVIAKANISALQLEIIRYHGAFARQHLAGIIEYTDEYDEWHITEDEDNVYGDTSMDNFDMEAFLAAIGVPPAAVDFDDSDY